MLKEPITVTVNGREVIGSGLVNSRGDENITLVVRDLRFLIDFRSTSDDEKKMNVVGELSDGKSLKLTLENFISPLGVAYWASVGSIDGRQLTLDLFVQSVGESNSNRLVTYTFCLGQAVSVG